MAQRANSLGTPETTSRLTTLQIRPNLCACANLEEAGEERRRMQLINQDRDQPRTQSKVTPCLLRHRERQPPHEITKPE